MIQTGPKTKKFPKKDKVTGQVITNPLTGEKVYDEQIDLTSLFIIIKRRRGRIGGKQRKGRYGS